MCSLSVSIHRDEVPADLRTLMQLPQASFFQSAEWLRALQSARPHYRPCVVAVRNREGELQAACALVGVSRFGLQRFYGGPLGTYGALLARTPEAARLAAQRVERLARARRVLLVRLHDFAGTLDAQLGPRWKRVAESCQVLDLSDDAHALFKSAFTAQNRNKIRKAEKAGVSVRCAGGGEALRRYTELYRESTRRWRLTRALPRSLFAALADAGPGVDVWLAERDGETVAALLNLRGGGQIMNWGNVSRRDAWRFAPNNLLHWCAIEAACLDREGPRLYNFGSSAGLPGVHAFKSAFGAREHRYVRLESVSTWASWIRRRK
jgi:CelD/BcsL family acetyltransferase involved in cellulose biosynthesis